MCEQSNPKLWCHSVRFLLTFNVLCLKQNKRTIFGSITHRQSHVNEKYMPMNKVRLALVLMPWKNHHMEPENHWVVEENRVPNVHFQVPCDSSFARLTIIVRPPSVDGRGRSAHASAAGALPHPGYFRSRTSLGSLGTADPPVTFQTEIERVSEPRAVF